MGQSHDCHMTLHNTDCIHTLLAVSCNHVDVRLSNEEIEVVYPHGYSGLHLGKFIKLYNYNFSVVKCSVRV